VVTKRIFSNESFLAVPSVPIICNSQKELHGRRYRFGYIFATNVRGGATAEWKKDVTMEGLLEGR
jgi:hypothetical protein